MCYMFSSLDDEWGSSCCDRQLKDVCQVLDGVCWQTWLRQSVYLGFYNCQTFHLVLLHPSWPWDIECKILNSSSWVCAFLIDVNFLSRLPFIFVKPNISDKNLVWTTVALNTFHLRPLTCGEMIILTTTSGIALKNPQFVSPTCDPRLHNQKYLLFLSGWMGSCAQKIQYFRYKHCHLVWTRVATNAFI